MNDLTPIPPSDPSFQLMEPMAQGHAPAPSRFRLQKFLFFLRKYWWIPLLTLILSVSTAVAIFFHTPPTFVSMGSLLEFEKLQLPAGAAFTDDHDNFIGTQAELLRDERLREMTLERMRATTNQIISDKDGNPLPVDIQVYSQPKSSLYIVQATSANPAYTPAYLNALMQTYLVFRKEKRREASSDALSSISTQIDLLEEQMKTAQAKLNDYERSNNFTALKEESSLWASYLGKMKTELSDYQLETNLLAARELEMNSGIGGTNSDIIFIGLRNSTPAVASPTDRMDAQKEIQLLQLERDRLAKYLKDTHPKMIKLNEEIEHAKKIVEVSSQQNHDQIVAARQVLQIKIDSVQQVINEYETKLAEANEKIAFADGLQQDILMNKGMFDQLSSLSRNVNIGQNIDQETLSIQDSASPATRSYAAAKAMLTQSVFIGLGLGLGIIFLIAIRDDRFNSVIEVTEKFGDSVVGQVPEVREISGAGPLALLGDNDERHVYAESYRNLRSALLYLAVDGQRPKVLVITSSVPDEGKSTVATNLARAMAMGGSKVLLIDGDLRKGRIHDLLKLQSKPGFSDLLRDPVNPGKFIQATDLQNFDFISRGNITRNPGDLLLNPALNGLLAQLRAQYDYVLIDSSPVFAADDTSTLAPKADGVLFVVRSRFSHARVVREALELLFQRQARVLGLILNRSDSSNGSYSYYKYAEYYSTNSVLETDGDA